MKIEIKNRFDAGVIFAGEFPSLKLAVEHCVSAEISLDGANLDGANLSGASLSGARLVRASLVHASLDGASLDGARLDGANLSGARLDGANLAGAPFAVPHLDAKILGLIEANEKAIAADPKLRGTNALRMADWHTCGMSHCRGGYAVMAAGEAGRTLEFTVGVATAANLIYAASRPKQPIPNFFATDEQAMADIKACAAADPLPEGEAK